MSFPTEFDFVLVKIGDGGGPEAFTLICGIEDVTVTEDVNTTDRFRRDCEKPGSVPKRRSKVTGEQWQVSGSGVANLDQIDLLSAAKGMERNYELEFGRRDGTDAGEIIATATGAAILTNRTISNTADGGGMEITLTGQNELTWDSPS
jgi:hypothetical protein